MKLISAFLFSDKPVYLLCIIFIMALCCTTVLLSYFSKVWIRLVEYVYEKIIFLSFYFKILCLIWMCNKFASNFWVIIVLYFLFFSVHFSWNNLTWLFFQHRLYFCSLKFPNSSWTDSFNSMYLSNDAQYFPSWYFSPFISRLFLPTILPDAGPRWDPVTLFSPETTAVYLLSLNCFILIFSPSFLS